MRKKKWLVGAISNICVEIQKGATMFSARLKQFRIAQEMTQEQAGKAIHKSRSAYQAYEDGRTEPSVNSIIALSKAFNITPNELVGWEE